MKRSLIVGAWMSVGVAVGAAACATTPVATGSANTTETARKRLEGKWTLVALTVSVDEGVRQILRDIATEGVRRTDPTLVSRELKLDIGKPVDRAAWAQARKRLYDTSVFRQVDVQAVPIEP